MAAPGTLRPAGAYCTRLWTSKWVIVGLSSPKPLSRRWRADPPPAPSGIDEWADSKPLGADRCVAARTRVSPGVSGVARRARPGPAGWVTARHPFVDLAPASRKVKCTRKPPDG
jgi:hypothetical protein